ncbi:hypothetical protein NQ317_014933 [Molorchus minor]|uniref:FGFR1 oncogene partner (FOP) N-terminal dimerisation domain-containing protein n=1 Tax=Molorchus minor TaxID=1323400 RepID=A0ABQ9JZN3_9CUCU|nr:hypothetical protein NQ317_014933 [Molorchus minor]
MSVEEEIELKDLVAQTLESNGCLARIRAQLRASIFLALDEDAKLSKQQPLLNNKVNTHLETEEGKAMFCIVREFLEFFSLYFTISVFEPESYMGSGYKYEGRRKLVKDLGLDNVEDPTVPILLQLIRIAQTKPKSIDIDLHFNKNGMGESKSLSQDIETNSNLKKTDSESLISKAYNDNEKFSGTDKSRVENSLELDKINTTYELSSPTVSLRQPEHNIKKPADAETNSKDLLDNTNNKIDNKDDDTYEDTSSIAEDMAHNLDNTRVPEILTNGLDSNIEYRTNEGVLQPVLKEGKNTDKLKLSPQKPKSSLSSLSDLPPLQMSKNRVNDILPSLYSKDFKDKSNLRELDKLFDMEAEYEEDFMCSGDELSVKPDYLKSDSSMINLLEDLQSTNTPEKNKDPKQNKSPHRIISDCNKPMFKSLVNNNQIIKDKLLEGVNGNENGGSSSTISEHLDLELASSD